MVWENLLCTTLGVDPVENLGRSSSVRASLRRPFLIGYHLCRGARHNQWQPAQVFQQQEKICSGS